MRYLACHLAVMLMILLGGVTSEQGAQAQPLAAGVGFRNDLKVPVIVQGVSLINKMQRRGQPFIVQPGKTVWDSNLPLGAHLYHL